MGAEGEQKGRVSRKKGYFSVYMNIIFCILVLNFSTLAKILDYLSKKKQILTSVTLYK